MQRACLDYDTPHVADAQDLDLLRSIVTPFDRPGKGDVTALGIPVVYDGRAPSFDRGNPYPEVAVWGDDKPLLALDNDIPEALMPRILKWFAASEKRIAGCEVGPRLAAALLPDIRFPQDRRSARMVLWFLYDFLAMDVWSPELGDRFGIARSRVNGTKTDLDQLMDRCLAIRRSMNVRGSARPSRIAVLEC